MKIKHSIKIAFNQIPSLRGGAERAWYLLVCLLRCDLAAVLMGQEAGGRGREARETRRSLWLCVSVHV